MKKPILLILIIVVACILSACTNSQSVTEPGETMQGRLEIPSFDGTQLRQLVYINNTDILLFYSTYVGEAKSVIALVDVTSNEITTIYAGSLPFDVDSIYDESDESYRISNPFGEVIVSKRDLSKSEVIYESPTGARLVSPDGEYSLFREQQTINLVSNRDQQAFTLDTVGRTISLVKWGLDSSEFAYVSDGADIVLVDTETLSFRIMSLDVDFPSPEGFVFYSNLHHIDDNRILLESVCETKTVYQIIDKTEAEQVWSYEGKGRCELFGVSNCFAVIKEGSNTILLCDLESNTTKSIFEVTNEDIRDAAISLGSDSLAIALRIQDKNFIELLSFE